MRKLSFIVPVWLLAAAFAISLVPSARAAEWLGSYGYRGNSNTVQFTLELSGSRGPITGRTSEKNTFGNPSATHLYANIRGAINGSSITFTKTYDGTGGVSHSVEYSGTITGNTMSGTWRIGRGSGPFTAVLVRESSSPSSAAPSSRPSACDRCERFKGQSEACNSCCHCQQTNNIAGCRSQSQNNPDLFAACLNRASRSRENCNQACFGR